MIRKGFKMKLFPNKKDEYRKRHQNLTIEMKKEIKAHGGGNYTIFLDEKTNTLFGYIEVENENQWKRLANTEACQKWWNFMSDIMETNIDKSPVTVDLTEVFHLD